VLGDLISGCADAFLNGCSVPGRPTDPTWFNQSDSSGPVDWIGDAAPPARPKCVRIHGGLDGDEPPSGNKSDLEKQNKQKRIAELLANYEKAYREGEYKHAYQFAALAHELDPDDVPATCAMVTAKAMIRKQFHEEAKQRGSPSCIEGGSFEKVDESTGKQDESPGASEVLGALGHLCSGCMDAFLGACAGSSCPDEPDTNVPHCSDHALRQIEPHCQPSC